MPIHKGKDSLSTFLFGIKRREQYLCKAGLLWLESSSQNLIKLVLIGWHPQTTLSKLHMFIKCFKNWFYHSPDQRHCRIWYFLHSRELYYDVSSANSAWMKICVLFLFEVLFTIIVYRWWNSSSIISLKISVVILLYIFRVSVEIASLFLSRWKKVCNN